jgi:predicted nucleic acid-binding Zn ribbon protein
MRRPGERSGPEPLGEILSRLFTARGWGRRGERQRLEDAWRAAAGEDVAAKTRVGSLRRGVLEIEVGNGVLMQELASFRKRKLLEDLKAKLPGTPLRELKFRAGGV